MRLQRQNKSIVAGNGSKKKLRVRKLPRLVAHRFPMRSKYLSERASAICARARA
jgi:hypothetical protein